MEALAQQLEELGGGLEEARATAQDAVAERREAEVAVRRLEGELKRVLAGQETAKKETGAKASTKRGAEPIKTIKPAPRRAVAKKSAPANAAKKSSGGSNSKAKAALRKKLAVDDLQLLTGVGPAFAKHLKQAGITSFEQIVDFGAEKRLDELAEMIDVGTDRIRRDKWTALVAA